MDAMTLLLVAVIATYTALVLANQPFGAIASTSTGIFGTESFIAAPTTPPPVDLGSWRVRSARFLRGSRGVPSRASLALPRVRKLSRTVSAGYRNGF